MHEIGIFGLLEKERKTQIVEIVIVFCWGSIAKKKVRGLANDSKQNQNQD